MRDWCTPPMDTGYKAHGVSDTKKFKLKKKKKH